MNNSSEHFEKASQGMIEACEEMSVTCRRSMDAMIESTTALSKGCEEFSRKIGDLMQESMSRTIAASKNMMAAKSPKEFADLHNEFMKESVDRWMAGTGRLSEISARMTQETFEPVTKHANAAINKAMHKTQQQAERVSGRAA
jgi:phasin family protein